MSLFITLNIYAQQRQISGTVRSSDDGETLPGVSILIKGSSQGTATDVDGTYKMNIPSGPVVLVFSFVGYTPAEVEVGNRDVVDMELTPEARRLDEVVVTALGVKS